MPRRALPQRTEDSTADGSEEAAGGLLWSPSIVRALAPLAAALAVVAAVAGSAGGLGAGKSSLRDGPASDVFTITLTLVCLAVAACVVVCLRTLPTPSRFGISSKGRRRNTLAERLAALALLAAFIGLGALLLTRRSHVAHHVTLAALGSPRNRQIASKISFSAPAAGATILAVLAVAAITIGLPAWRRRRWARARGPLHPMSRPPSRDGLSDFPSGALTAAVAGVTVSNPEDEPDPRKAIVAAYIAMTEAAAKCGALRESYETPSEYLQRLLGIAGAPARPASRLTGIFERARYSSEPLGEDGRSVAISSLRDIRAGIGAAG
ncbi:MAG: DUF4129 domain-containing protein [Acidimicrobiales bacterium]